MEATGHKVTLERIKSRFKAARTCLSGARGAKHDVVVRMQRKCSGGWLSSRRLRASISVRTSSPSIILGTVMTSNPKGIE